MASGFDQDSIIGCDKVTAVRIILECDGNLNSATHSLLDTCHKVMKLHEPVCECSRNKDTDTSRTNGFLSGASSDAAQ